MTKYVISVDVPHPSLLPLGYQKLREIGWSVGTLFVPPSDTDACPRCGAALEPIPPAGMVCVREGCRA